MSQLFCKPDRYIGVCGRLACEVVEHRVEAPEFLRGTRALFLSDAHVTRRTTEADLDAFAARVAEIAPDLVLWGGDFADEAVHARRLFNHLRAIAPPLGSFAAPGNNDREAWSDLGRLREVMADAGIRLLVNESVEIPVGAGWLTIAGVDEYFRGAPDSAGLYPETVGPDAWRLLISHFPILPERLPDLMLSGHTHGGQFNLLGLTPYTIGFERLFSRKFPPAYVAGIYEAGATRLLVSKGIGASRIPLRVGVRPEIDLVVFT